MAELLRTEQEIKQFNQAPDGEQRGTRGVGDDSR